jgi:hypothetical protein
VEYLRVASLFRVRFDRFERKKYVNLSHAPNKAMNLNSYLSLVGGTFREVVDSAGKMLVRCEPDEATLTVPAYRFIVTIDADSLITHDFVVRLLDVMTRPGNERVAIAQSPYTAIPNAPETIEHAAAAATDSQFFSHQGIAFFKASSWVGASALMRYEALRDIVRTRTERGHRIEVFIDDEIQIEDAAATIDLLRKGWQIYHDDRRLSYSATPHDFGSLIIQRRRWANGGLLILPRLLLHVLARPWSVRRWADALLRVPNLTSAATNSAFLCLLLLVPFGDDVVPPWIAVVGLPALTLTAIDLVRAGYRLTDLFRVQALLTLLIPVNLAGTIQSLRQAILGRQIPFARTPKISGRTRTPRSYLFGVYGFMLYAAGAAMIDIAHGRYVHAAFAAVNVLLLLYCIVAFIGPMRSLEDLGIHPKRLGGPKRAVEYPAQILR